MRKANSQFFISLDDAVDSPDKWDFRHFDEDGLRANEAVAPSNGGAALWAA